jgi:hypothetical protein
LKSRPLSTKLFTLGIFIGIVSCAHYEAASIAPFQPSIERISFSEGFGVAAEAYSDSENQKRIFDADIRGNGLIPIRLYVVNKNAQSASVRRAEITLKLEDGRQISTLSSELVAAQVGEGGSPVAASITLPSAMLSAEARSRSRNERLSDYRRKEFKDAQLVRNQSAEGFLFFKPAPRTKPFDYAELMVRFFPVGGEAAKVVSVRLSGLQFQGAK